MELTRYEQDTVINYNREETVAYVYTSGPVDSRRMAKLMVAHPDDVRLQQQDEQGVTYTVPKSWIKVRAPRKVSDEQRAAMSERARVIFSQKSSTIHQ